MRRAVVFLLAVGAVLVGAGEDRAVIRPGDSTSNCEVVKAIF